MLGPQACNNTKKSRIRIEAPLQGEHLEIKVLNLKFKIRIVVEMKMEQVSKELPPSSDQISYLKDSNSSASGDQLLGLYQPSPSIA